MAMIRRHAQPLLTILFLPALLAELGSGNHTLVILLRPFTLAFIVLAYGLPILIIREIAIRYTMQLASLFILGVAYGIYNEGVLAHTLTRADHVPLPTFDHYSYRFGINFPWMIFIVCWHACFSVVFPLLLLSLIYPQYRHEVWIGTKTFVAVAVCVLVLVPSLFALSLPVYTLLFMLAIFLLVGIAFLFHAVLPIIGESIPIARWHAFWFGICSILFLFGAVLLSERKIPFVLFVAVFVVSFVACLRYALRRYLLRLPALWFLVIGAYLSYFLISLLIMGIRGSGVGVLTGLILIAGILALLNRLCRQ